MNKVVCFDFDGVICNSTEECLITGYNAWLKYQGQEGFITKPEEVSSDLANYFRKWRGLVRTGDQYFLLFNSFTDSKLLKDEADFEKRNEIKKPEKKKYKELFFEARVKLREQDFDYWVSLHEIFDGISEGFKEMMNMADVYIVTGKDRDSAKAFLKSMEIDFPKKKIYDKSVADNKLLAVEKISRLTGQKQEDIIFLDDNINHLLNLKQGGCQVLMAGWGYHLDEHLEKAQSSHIEILSLENWFEHIVRMIKIKFNK